MIDTVRTKKKYRGYSLPSKAYDFFSFLSTYITIIIIIVVVIIITNFKEENSIG